VLLPKHTETQAELRDLVAANWNTASSWTYDQYTSAQEVFSGIRDGTSFDNWDESRLREFLLKQGVVAPKGPKEHLVQLAKSKYSSFMDAASSFSSRAGAAASTAVYGDTQHQMSKSVSSLASQATSAATQAHGNAVKSFDQSKDYVYSTWSDNEMRTWLEKKGIIKTKSEKKTDELLQMMHDAYGSVANPVWDAWSDSYLHNWLVSHNIVKSDYEKNRDALITQMKMYYYGPTEMVWSAWSDSQLKHWLIDHGVVKSDAQASRDKMIKMVGDNYVSAKDIFWSAWSDNSIRQWLVDHEYMRSDAQVKRDELIKLANEKYSDQHARMATYLTWPDARLRAYLRRQGVSEEYIPGDRPNLLQETRIRWVQTQNGAEVLFSKIKEVVNSGVYKADDVLHRLWSLLMGGWEDGKGKAKTGYENVKDAGKSDWEETKKRSADAYEEWAEDPIDKGREKLGEKVQVGERMGGEL
jgi:hypothetical protein